MWLMIWDAIAQLFFKELVENLDSHFPDTASE